MLKQRKYPRRVFVRQHDEKDCGPACLCSVSEVYGRHLPIARARQLAGTDMHGTTVYGMAKAAKELGLEAIPLKGAPADLEREWNSGRVSLPMIAHTITPNGTQHYVVALALRGDDLVLADPAHGKRIVSLDAFFAQWSGIAIALSGDLASEESYGSVSLAHLFGGLLRGNLALVVAAIVMSLILTAIGVACAFVFQYVIDGVVLRAEKTSGMVLAGELARVCICVAVLYVVQSLITCIRAYVVSLFSNRLDLKIASDFYAKLISLPLDFFCSRRTGEILSRFNDAAKIREAVSSISLTATIDVALVLVGVIVLFAVSASLACIAVILFCLYACLALLWLGRLKSANASLMEANALLQSHLKEIVDGIETVKVFGAESAAKEEMASKLNDLLKNALRTNLLVANQSAVVSLLCSLATVAILWVGASEVLAGSLTLGALITFNALVGFFMDPVERLVGLQPDIQAAVVAFRRLGDINDLQSEEISDTEDGAGFTVEDASLVFKDVRFCYGSREDVLRGVSLSILPGEKVAIIGESGSGKTTLVKLALGLLHVNEGYVEVGGANVAMLGKRVLRQHVSYLSQEPFLFSGTVEDNIRLGNPRASKEEFLRVCDLCCVTEFVESMPMGFATRVGERGAALSGGQKQRIALARVLLRNSRIVILDEATSNLDPETEDKVMKGVLEGVGDTTCILVSHRLSTIRRCDRIILMRQGEIVEEHVGGYQQLSDDSISRSQSNG